MAATSGYDSTTGPPPYISPADLASGAAGAAAAEDGTAASGGAAPGGAPTPLGTAYAPSYDPNAAQPYQQAQLPQTQQPIENPLPPEPQMTPQQLGSSGKLGAAAFLGNQLLHGYMQGKAVHDLKQAAQVHQQSTGLQNLYNNAAGQLQDLAQKGIPQDDPAYIKAKEGVDTTWKAMMDFYGQHVEKPGKGKNGQQSLMQKLQGAFQSQDPAKVSSAVYEGLQQTGPPVYHQIAPYLTPAYQQRVQTAAQTAGTQAQTGLETAQTAQGTQHLENELVQMRQVQNPTEAQQDRMDQLNNMLGKPGSGLAQAKDAVARQILGDPTLTNDAKSEKLRALSSKMPNVAPPKVGSFGDFAIAGYGPQPTAKQYLEARKLWNEAQASSTTGTHMIAVPQPDGGVKMVQVQTTSQKSFPGAPTAGLPDQRQGNAPGQMSTTAPTLPANPPTTGGLPPSAPAGATGAAAPAPNYTPQGTPTQVSVTTLNAKGHPTTTRSGGAPPAPAGGEQPPAPATGGGNPYTGGIAQPGQTVGGRVPNQERLSADAMEDVGPPLQQAIKMLAPFKDEGGLMDSLNQRFKYGQYQFGIDPGALATAVNQWNSFIKIAGTAPWSKIGRNMALIKSVQEHLPDPSKDSPGLMYRKLLDAQNILNGQAASYQARNQRMVSGGGPAPLIGSTEIPGQEAPKPVTVMAGGKPHTFDTQAQADEFTKRVKAAEAAAGHK